MNGRGYLRSSPCLVPKNTLTVCSLAQIRENFGKRMLERVFYAPFLYFFIKLKVCRALFRPRTDGVGVPPLFSQGGRGIHKSVGKDLERSGKIWATLLVQAIQRPLMVGGRTAEVSASLRLSARTDVLRCGCWHSSHWVVWAEWFLLWFQGGYTTRLKWHTFICLGLSATFLRIPCSVWFLSICAQANSWLALYKS